MEEWKNGRVEGCSLENRIPTGSRVGTRGVLARVMLSNGCRPTTYRGSGTPREQAWMEEL